MSKFYWIPLLLLTCQTLLASAGPDPLFDLEAYVQDLSNVADPSDASGIADALRPANVDASDASDSADALRPATTDAESSSVGQPGQPQYAPAPAPADDLTADWQGSAEPPAGAPGPAETADFATPPNASLLAPFLAPSSNGQDTAGDTLEPQWQQDQDTLALESSSPTLAPAPAPQQAAVRGPSPSPQKVPTPRRNSPPPPRRSPSPPPPPPGGVGVGIPLSTDQKRRAEELTSIFENSSTKLAYVFAKDIGDGRGITFGRCGFCTGTGDGLLVVREYTRLKRSNPLAKYLPALERIDKRGGGADKTGLGGFENVVRSLTNDATFRAAQDSIADKLYYKPSLGYGAKVGVRLPLTKGQLFDTIIQHGDGGDRGSIQAIIKKANDRAGGSPAQGVDEVKWLSAFLAARRSLLASYDRAWADSVTRVDVYSKILAAGDLMLDGPIYIGLKKTSSSSGWEINNSYYGRFTVPGVPVPVGADGKPLEKYLLVL